jgi:hypothetical protein
MFNRFLLFLAGLLLAACASVPLPPSTSTPLGILTAATDTATAYVDFSIARFQRGAITLEQFERAISRSKIVKSQIELAAKANSACPPAPAPCPGYLQALSLLQPALLELEKELRAKETAK